MTATSIYNLEQRIRQIQAFIDEKKLHLTKNPDDFLSKIEMESLESHLSDVSQQLSVERASANNELLEMRLHGTQVARGSIPLSMLAKIADPLQKSISQAVYSIASGGCRIKNLTNKINSETLASITRDLDLRLIGIGTGSTRLFITGNTKPDLSDTTFLPAAIESIINLLNANEDNFYDYAHHIGAKSSMQIKNLVEALDKEFASVDITWHNQNNEVLKWEGRRDQIIKVRELLDRIAEPETSSLVISGEVVLLAKTGRLEIISEGDKFKIKYPARLFADVSSKMRIGQSSRVEVDVRSFFDSVRQQTINLYSLVKII